MKTSKMHGPAVYRIRVHGRLDGRWSALFGGMNITETKAPDTERETILVGRLADQAALMGVLNALHDAHLSVISLDCLESG